MKLEFNKWLDMLKTVVELGKENGYEIYEESNSDKLKTCKEIIKSCKYDKTVFLNYGENIKTKEECFMCKDLFDNLVEAKMYEGNKVCKYKVCSYCYRKLELQRIDKNKEYVIAYSKDCGANIVHKKEIYIGEESAYIRYNSLKSNSNVYDLKIREV